MEITALEMATLALRVLEAQKTFFKTRTREDLIASKLLENELRHKSHQVLNEQVAQAVGGQ